MADFFLHWPEVIIEVDGPEHMKTLDQARDAQVRDLFAYETVRVTNKDVTDDNIKTREKLIRFLAKVEGLNTRQIRARVKEYFERQKEEGML
jgi:very-short-patch-repair endonuclease